MKDFSIKILGLLAVVAALVLSGCASEEGVYQDDAEYSSMPWNTPQQWEAAPSIPGMSPGY